MFYTVNGMIRAKIHLKDTQISFSITLQMQDDRICFFKHSMCFLLKQSVHLCSTAFTYFYFLRNHRRLSIVSIALQISYQTIKIKLSIFMSNKNIHKKHITSKLYPKKKWYCQKVQWLFDRNSTVLHCAFRTRPDKTCRFKDLIR